MNLNDYFRPVMTSQTLTRVLAFFLIATLAGFSATLPAKTENIVQFDNPKDAERYEELTHEIRCLVCQNQTIAESDADLAKDLRKEVYDMVGTGKSNEDIVDFLVKRYGDFVMFRPPLKTSTLLLWFGPGAVIFLILIFLWKNKSGQQIVPDQPLSEEERKQLQALLSQGKDQQP